MPKNGKQDGRGAKSTAGGVQLPMELSFITVDQPGQRIPYAQLSQITAHAMRKSHERRRGMKSTVAQPSRQQAKSTNTSKDSTHVHAVVIPVSSNGEQQRHRQWKGVHQTTEQIYPNADELITHVISNSEEQPGPCQCSFCQTQALIRRTAAVYVSADMVFGGYKTDPFLRYPIPFQGYFPAAVDICRDAIAPSSSFFELVMSHDVLFEAVLSWILCTTLAQTPELKRAFISHYGSALARVSARLTSPGSTRRAVMAAMSNLAGVCAFLEDDAGFDSHRNALQFLAGFNVNEDLPKPNLTTKRPTKLYDALSSARSRSTKGDRDNATDKFTCGSSEPVYPKIPFSAALRRRVESLPPGFAALAQRKLISIQVIERLGMSRAQVVGLAARAPMDREDFRVLKQKMTLLERMVWIAFSVFHLCTATYKVDREELAEAFIKYSQRGNADSKEEAECLLWGGCMVATIQGLETWDLPRRQEAMDILLSNCRLSVEEMIAVAEKFLWNETMSAAIKELVQDRSVVGPKVAEGASWRTFL